MMICGMPGSAVIVVLLIVVSLHCCRRVVAGSVFLAGLQCRQQVVEPLMAFVPEPLVAGQPGGHLPERFGLQEAEPRGGPPWPRAQRRPLPAPQGVRGWG